MEIKGSLAVNRDSLAFCSSKVTISGFSLSWSSSFSLIIISPSAPVISSIKSLTVGRVCNLRSKRGRQASKPLV